MIEASQIAHLRAAASDYTETVNLKAEFARLRDERQPFFLTLGEFDKILQWKLGGQYHRQRLRRLGNTDETVSAVTSTALTISHEDKDYELELRMGILCTLRGVGVPVASAVLALVLPSQYCVIDFCGWRQVFAQDRTSFSISDYKRYLHEVKRLADDLGWPVQEVDLAIWVRDKLTHSA